MFTKNSKRKIRKRKRRTRPSVERLEIRALLATVTVTNAIDDVNGITDSITSLNNDPGPDGISLREAILAANNTPNLTLPDQIRFDIPGASPYAITVSTVLPTINDPVVIDATTQAGYVNTPVVSVASDGVATGMSITAGSSTVAGLGFEDFDTGLVLAGPGVNTISEIDVSWAGETPTGTGIRLAGSDNIIENITATNRHDGLLVLGVRNDNTIQGSNFSGAGRYAIGPQSTHGAQGNKYFGNDLSGAGSWALFIIGDREFEVSGNDLTDSANGVSLSGIDGSLLPSDDLVISPAAGPGQLDIDVSTIPGTGLGLGVSNATISGLDVSWAGETPTGTGIRLAGSDNIIENITATNRHDGLLVLGGANGNTIQGSNFSGAGRYAIGPQSTHDAEGNKYFGNDLSGAGSWALFIIGDREFEVSGNDLTDSANGVSLSGIDGSLLPSDDLVISPAAGPGQLDIDVSTIPGTGLGLGVSNATISGLDVSRAGETPTGTGIRLAGSDNIIENITATNRHDGLLVLGGANDNTIQGSNFSGAGRYAIAPESTHGAQRNKYFGNDLSVQALGHSSSLATGSSRSAATT